MRFASASAHKGLEERALRPSLGVALVSWICLASAATAGGGLTSSDVDRLLRAGGMLERESSAADQARTRVLDDVGRTLVEGRYREAREKLDAIALDEKDDPRFWLLATLAHLGLGEELAARKAADRCVETAPSMPGGHILRGIVATSLREFLAAGRSFDQAIAVAPRNPDGYLHRGRFLVLHFTDSPDRIRAGAVDLERALELGTDSSASARGLLGLAYRRLKQPAEAERRFRESVDLDPTRLDALRELVSLLLEQRRIEDAKLAVSTARSRSKPESLPSEERGNLAMAEALVALADGAPAEIIERHFREARRRRPEDARVLLKHVDWLEKGGRVKEALELLRDEMRRSDPDPDAAARLAWSLAELNQALPEARRAAAVARGKLGNDPYLADTEAWIEHRAGDHVLAWSKLLPALPLTDTVPEVAYHAGAIKAALGDRSEALKYLGLSLRSNAGFSGRNEALALSRSLRSDSTITTSKTSGGSK